MRTIWKCVKRGWVYILAFVIPIVVLVLHSLIFRTWIVGNGNLLTGDTLAQITPFCYELWDKVHLGESLMYSWNIAGGIDFYSVLGYFVSPFTLLFLIFPRDGIPYVMQIVMILKWSLSAVSMTYYFIHTSNNKLRSNKKIVALFLGIAFCMGNAMVCYMTYIQFGDAIICFPILLLLLERLIETNRWKFYYIVLTFCIISNSYITYQICIFLILWFFLQIQREKQHKFKKFMLFAGSSVLAAISSLFFLVPGMMAMRSRALVTNTSSRLAYCKTILINARQFILQWFPFKDISQPSDIEPNIYCSVIIVFVLLLYPMIKIPLKEKLRYLLVFIVMMISLFSGYISIVWHMFNVPNGVYHRFVYIYTFYCLYLALAVLQRLSDIKLWNIMIVGVIMLGSYIYAFFASTDYMSFWVYLVAVLLIALYFMIFILYSRKSIKYSNMVLVIIVFGIIELSANAFYTVRNYDSDAAFGQNGRYAKDALLIEQTKLEKGERLTGMEPTSNINLLANKASDSGFVSAINGFVMYLFERLGMAYNGSVEYGTRGASPLLNLMFNIKYGMGASSIEFSDADKVDENDLHQLYKMRRLAGLGYMVDKDVVKWNVREENCFEVQNKFVQLATDVDKNIFNDIEPNLVCTNSFGIKLKRDAEYEKYKSYVYYTKEATGNMDTDALRFEFTAEEDMDLYTFWCSSQGYNVVVLIDDEMVHCDERSFNQSTYHIGKVKKGQIVSLYAFPESDTRGMESKILLRFAKFDESVYADAYEQLSDNVYNIEEMRSDYVKGTIDVEKDGLMLTSIFVSDGFQVFVDNEPVDYNVIGDALIGVELKKGLHTVEFKYATPYLMQLGVISMGAFVLFSLICIYDEVRKRRQLIISEE